MNGSGAPGRARGRVARALLRALAIGSLLVAAAGPRAGAEESGPRRWSAPEGGSRVGFLLSTFWHEVEGTTDRVEAVLESPGDPLESGVVRISVEAGALQTGSSRRDRKMREEHLETDRFPSIAFHSTAPPRRLASGRDGGSGTFVEVQGELSLHGVVRPLTLPVEAVPRPGGWLMKAAFRIKLSEYGIADPSVLLNRVDDEVAIYLEILLVDGSTEAATHPGP